MGYRSQVGYVIQGDEAEMISTLVTYRLENPNAKTALDECTYSKHDGVVTIKFYAEDTKWYDSYEYVICHTELFDAFRAKADDSEDSTINGMFMRIGEDDADVVADSYGDDPYELMSLQRSFDFEVDAEKSLEEILV